jgi:DNA-binding response OmpR family regulator
LEDNGNSLRPLILIADDDAGFRALVSTLCLRAGYDCVEAESGSEAIAAALAERPDVVLVDVDLGDASGYEVCRELRNRFGEGMPIIFISGTTTETYDRVAGLQLGADDYVTKPFAVRELVARVRAIMRRAAVPAGQRPDELTYDRLRINLPSRRVSADGEEVDLTYTEFELLVTLASSPGRVFSRSALLRRVWGDEFRDERTVDVHIRHLREKIERDPRNPEFIHTARGVGYVFR